MRETTNPFLYHHDRYVLAKNIVSSDDAVHRRIKQWGFNQSYYVVKYQHHRVVTPQSGLLVALWWSWFKWTYIVLFRLIMVIKRPAGKITWARLFYILQFLVPIMWPRTCSNVTRDYSIGIGMTCGQHDNDSIKASDVFLNILRWSVS